MVVVVRLDVLPELIATRIRFVAIWLLEEMRWCATCFFIRKVSGDLKQLRIALENPWSLVPVALLIITAPISIVPALVLPPPLYFASIREKLIYIVAKTIVNPPTHLL